MIPAGVVHEDERKRTAVEVSKRYEMVSKLEECSDSRISVAEEPMSWPHGIRYGSGVSMDRALTRNVRTCRHDAKGEHQMSGPHEMQCTDAWHTGGAACSSDDAS